MNVDPDAIRRYAQSLGLRADNVIKVRDYGRTWGSLSFEEKGLLSTTRLVHTEFIETLTTTLEHLVTVLETSELELGRAADYYQATNAAAVAATDLTYPPVDRPVIAAI